MMRSTAPLIEYTRPRLPTHSRKPAHPTTQPTFCREETKFASQTHPLVFHRLPTPFNRADSILPNSVFHSRKKENEVSIFICANV